jgi:hypothetical protein
MELVAAQQQPRHWSARFHAQGRQHAHLPSLAHRRRCRSIEHAAPHARRLAVRLGAPLFSLKKINVPVTWRLWRASSARLSPERSARPVHPAIASAIRAGGAKEQAGGAHLRAGVGALRLFGGAVLRVRSGALPPTHCLLQLVLQLLLRMTDRAVNRRLNTNSHRSGFGPCVAIGAIPRLRLA